MTQFPAHYALTTTLNALSVRLASQRAMSHAAVDAAAGYSLHREILTAVVGHSALSKDCPPP